MTETSGDRPYELMDHGSDLMIRARGNTLEETLANLLRGIMESVSDIERVAPIERKIVRVRAPSLERLAVRVCNELVYLMDAEKMVFREAIVNANSVTEGLECEVVLMGERVNPARHVLKACVKGATYGALVVRPDVVEMILDV